MAIVLRRFQISFFGRGFDVFQSCASGSGHAGEELRDVLRFRTFDFDEMCRRSPSGILNGAPIVTERQKQAGSLSGADGSAFACPDGFVVSDVLLSLLVGITVSVFGACVKTALGVGFICCRLGSSGGPSFGTHGGGSIAHALAWGARR